MRLILPSLSVLIALSCAGLHCAYADTPPARSSCDDAVLDQACPVPATPRMELVDDSAQTLPTFWQGGRRFVLGQTGSRYQIRIVNPTAERVEAVVSVDGLDAIDGHPANLNRRGYIVPAFGEVTIDGFRTSLDAVAAFRFSSVRESYAARTGRPRNVGVVGVAFFGERPAPVRRYRAPAPEMSRAQPSPPPSPAADAAESNAPSKSAGAAAGAAPAPAATRPGLGTQFGESRESHVVETAFVRASTTPVALSELRYDDREGLLSRGIQLTPPRDPRAAENERRDDAQSFPQSRFALPPP
jgi:hypothetical protein